MAELMAKIMQKAYSSTVNETIGGAEGTPYPKMFVPRSRAPKIDVGIERALHHHRAINLSGGDCLSGFKAN